MSGAKSSGPAANDRGTRPATPRSPHPPAPKNEQPIELPTPVRPPCGTTGEEFPRRGVPEPLEEGEAEERAIEREYEGMLLAARRLPRILRAGGRRVAREWRAAALKALRIKRMLERQAHSAAWKAQIPPPQP
jgi:hypothetical protein